MSEGGQIAVAGRQDAYASAATIQQANQALGATPARVRLEGGAPLVKTHAVAWTARFGADTPLLRLLPVFDAAVMAQQQPGATPVPGQATQPTGADQGNARQSKLAAYHATLSGKLDGILALRNELAQRWKQLEGRWVWVDSTPSVIWSEFNGRLVELVKATMGPMWFAAEDAIRVFNASEESRKKLTLEDHMKIFGKLAESYITRLTTELLPEMQMTQLWPTLPNDCKQAAAILTGKTGDQLSAGRSDPGIGDNYDLKFRPAAQYGWASHFATVVAKDARGQNTDNLTFETAANINAGMAEGKSLGYFELYGTANPLQTFTHIALIRNRQNMIRQADVDLRHAKSPSARAKVESERDKDLSELDMDIAVHIAAHTPLPQTDDEGL